MKMKGKMGYVKLRYERIGHGVECDQNILYVCIKSQRINENNYLFKKDIWGMESTDYSSGGPGSFSTHT